MACATLKRTLDWDSINQCPSKRRRCNPFEQTGVVASTSTAAAASASNSTRAISSLNLKDVFPSSYTKSSRAARLNRDMLNDANPTYNYRHPDAFEEANLPKMSPDKVVRTLRDELKRLHKRKQLLSSAAMERMQDSESSGSEMGPDSPHRPDSPPSVARSHEKAVFTFKQVQMICERMLKEREDELREEYNAVLTTKLAEQYDAFVKFTFDQIHSRYEAAPSYLS